MNVPNFVAARVEFSLRSLVLAVGDLVAILAFVLPGMERHGFPPLQYPMRALETFAPFLLGWLFAAFLGGLYTGDAIKNPRRVLSWTVPAWILALLVGHALRVVAFHGGTGSTFFAITLAIGGGLGVTWRVVASLVVD